MISFAITVFLSAFLLFQVQPIIAKMILPWFGGSSSVWSTCLVFFQVELLLGYLYVHLLHLRFAPRRQNVVHGVLLLLSLATLPVVADVSWKDAAFADPTWNVLFVLGSAVGLPYLLLSTTGPLMQAWVGRAFGSAMPYRLYALSNLASMLALLSYPVLVEPLLPVLEQARIWSLAYVAFVIACLASAWLSWRRADVVPGPGGQIGQSGQGGSAGSGESTHAPATLATAASAAAGEASPVAVWAAPPGWRECLLWVCLAMTASLLLLALTQFLTQDVAAVPFLWVLPLSIYLLSFILCFDAPRYYYRRGFLLALPCGLLVIDRVIAGAGGASPSLLIAALALSLFVFCMVCHGELVRRRPPVSHLTLFYLMLSIGGALGGMFVGLLAPAIFNAYYELPIGLFLCAMLAVIVVWRDSNPLWRALLVLALLAYGARLGQISVNYVDDYRRVLRNFYGQLRVIDTLDAQLGVKRKLLHGNIYHGEQYLAAEHRQRPTAYFCEKSGIGQAFLTLPEDGPRKIGIVGLGAGTLASYGRQGDEIRMYEINEQMLELARSEFSYLADTPARVVPILGDGRLMLESEPAQHFDLLVMDAFSGDSVPTHLLTVEAMRGYLRHLKDDGLLAVNITNNYLDLRPVVAAAAEQLGRRAVIHQLRADPADRFCLDAEWLLIAGPERAEMLYETIDDLRLLVVRPGFRPWTDDFSNLFNILK